MESGGSIEATRLAGKSFKKVLSSTASKFVCYTTLGVTSAECERSFSTMRRL